MSNIILLAFGSLLRPARSPLSGVAIVFLAHLAAILFHTLAVKDGL